MPDAGCRMRVISFGTRAFSAAFSPGRPDETVPIGGLMRRFTTYMTALLAALALAVTATAQVRGTGRLGGQVFDKATGKPIANATVTVSLPNGSTQPIVTNTDKNGRWSALGLTNGMWNIDIAASGYQTTRGTANVSEIQRGPPIKTEMVAEVKQEAAAAVAQSPLIPKEGVDAIDEAQALLKVKAGDANP